MGDCRTRDTGGHIKNAAMLNSASAVFSVRETLRFLNYRTKTNRSRFLESAQEQNKITHHLLCYCCNDNSNLHGQIIYIYIEKEEDSRLHAVMRIQPSQTVLIGTAGIAMFHMFRLT